MAYGFASGNRGYLYAMKLAPDARVVSRDEFLGRTEVLFDFGRLPKDVKGWVECDKSTRPSTFVGINAIRPYDRELVVFDRSKVIVDRRSLPDGEFYRPAEVDPQARIAEIEAETQRLVERLVAGVEPEEATRIAKQVAAMTTEAESLRKVDWRTSVTQRFAETYGGI